jgi:hypothetical protein
MFGRDAPLTWSIEDVKASLAVASRYYLRTSPNQTHPSFGAVDGKVSSAKLLFPSGYDQKPSYHMVAVSGPTWGDTGGETDLPVFDWAAYPTTSHVGQPESWGFEWMHIN